VPSAGAGEGLDCQPLASAWHLLSVAKVRWADDDSGNALFDRSAFYAQPRGRLDPWSSDDSYSCDAL